MIWHFCTLQTDHQGKSGYIISPCKDTTQLSTVFPTLCISYWWLIYLATGSLYLLISLIYFFLPPSLFLSDNNLLVLCTMALSVLLGLFICFLQIPHVGEIMYLSNLFHLALYSLDPCCHKGKISFFFMAEKYSTCVCVCVTSSLSIHLLVSTCFHILNNATMNVRVHMFFSNKCLCFLQINIQEWHC